MALRPSSVVRRLALPFVATFAFAAAAAPADRAVVKRISLLPEAEQRSAANQAVLQQWFFPRVTEFQEILSGTAIGSQVRLGDLTAWKKRFAAPAGRGDWVIVWQNRPGLGPTKNPGEPFYFPSDAFDTYFSGEGTLTTCWHELQHGLLAEHALSSPGFWGADQEHYYAEDFAQNTVLWLADLNRKDRFENLVREADTKAEQLRARGVEIDLAAERSLWANARAAWLSRWPAATRVTTPPSALRDEFERISGVRVPSVEEVISFYMLGGVRKAKGAPIRVPEWVLSPDEIRGAVAIEHDRAQDKIEAKPDLARYSFAIRVLDPRRAPGATTRIPRPVSRGVLLLKLETDDDVARIDVSAAGKPVSGAAVAGGTSGRRVEVDFRKLAGGTRPGGFLDVTFTRTQIRSLRVKMTYRIVAEYLDSRTPADPAVYHPSRAVFFVDVTPPAQAAGGAAPKGGPSAAAGAPGAGYFRLAKEERTGEPCERKGSSKSMDASFSGRLDGNRFRASFDITYSGEGQFEHSLDATYAPPPASLRDGDVLTFEISGAVKRKPADDQYSDGIRSRLEIGAGPSPFHWPIDCPGCMGYQGVRVPPDRQDNGAFRKAAATRIAAPKPAANVKELAPLVVTVVAAGPTHNCPGLRVEYRYEWIPGGAPAPSGETRVEARSELPPEPPTPPGLDEEPPREGEVVPVKAQAPKKPSAPSPPPPKRTPTPAPIVAGRWYEHPLGGYRIPLPKGYDARLKTNLGGVDAGYDTIFAPEESAALVCARGAVDIARKDPAEFLAAWSANVSRGNRSAVVRKQLVGGAPGTIVETFEGGVATHHVAFVSGGRAFHLSAAFPSPRPAPLPREIRVLIDGLVPVSGRPGASEKTR